MGHIALYGRTTVDGVNDAALCIHSQANVIGPREFNTRVIFSLFIFATSIKETKKIKVNATTSSAAVY